MRRLALCLVALGAISAEAAPMLRVIYSQSATAATLYWTAVPGAAHYDVERTELYPGFTLQSRQAGTAAAWGQSGLSSNKTYIYRIVPRDAALNPVGSPSNAAIVSTHGHLDNPLETTHGIKLQQLLDLRAVMKSVREAAGAGTPVWTRPTVTTASGIDADDLIDLRNALIAATTSIGLPQPSLIDPNVIGVGIRRAHFQQLRDLARSYPEYVSAAATISEPFFSPNGDGTKDSTTFNASATLSADPRLGLRWRVDVRNETNVIVRSVEGWGITVAFVWDGKNGGGAVQADGLYTFELVNLDSLSTPLAVATARLDVTPPTATITAPADYHVISNVRSSGSGNVVITGTASDLTLQQWKLEQQLGSVEPTPINTGTTAVSSATLGTWQTLVSDGTSTNGSYDLRLIVTDRAGNVSTDTVPISVGHFLVTRSPVQANIALNETVTYTSIVPFALTERIEIRYGTTLVRTLFNGPRAAGTYADVWDGKNDSGALVSDRLYSYVAYATEGSSTITWDRSASYPTGLISTQYEYPRCWSGTAWISCDSPSVDFGFDPFAGKPLRIAYCVGGGQPEGTCSGNIPALVVAKVTNFTDVTAACDAGCILNEYQAGGRHEILWYGFTPYGTFVADLPRLTVIRQFGAIPINATLLYGTAPVITSVTVTPPMLSPTSIPVPVAGQTVAVGITRFTGRTVRLSAVFRSMANGSTLRTITTAMQAADVLSVSWDGRSDGDKRVAPGRYEVVLTVTDSNDLVATVRTFVIVRY